MFGIGDTLKQAWYGLWVLIDSLVYSLISIAYQVFNLIAKASLYNSENGDIKVMVERISVILGIGMLFIIAYNIILNIMNPDKASSSGDKSMQGIFKNAIIAIVMLTAYSTVFTYMTRIQNHIIDSQVIEKIILGADETNNTSSSDMGATVAAKIFTTFFYPIDDNGNVVTYETNINNATIPQIVDIKYKYFICGFFLTNESNNVELVINVIIDPDSAASTPSL